MLKDKILQKVSQEEIYSHYLTDFDSSVIRGNGQKGRNIKSVFVNDGSNPDMSIFWNKDKTKILYKCHVSDNKGDVFQLVGSLKGIDCNNNFKEVLNVIQNDMKINLNGSNGNHHKKTNGVTYGRWHGEYVDFTEKALEYWRQFGVKAELLKQYNCKQLKSLKYKSVGKERYNKFTYITDDFEIMSFEYKVNGKYKLYQPSQLNKKGEEIKKYILKTQTASEIFGFEQLEQKQEMIIICEGEKDALCAIANGYTAVSFQSATHYPTVEQIHAIKRRCKYLFICYDNDTAGKKMSGVLSYRYNLINIELPSGFKDIADYFSASPNNIGIFENERIEVLQEWKEENKINLWTHKAAYWKNKTTKDYSTDVKISDFTIHSKALVLNDETSNRIITIKTRKGETKPFQVSSEDFISVQKFQSMIAKKVNETFYGDTTDLNNIRRLVFEDTPVIKEINGVGYFESEKKYIFQNAIIENDGTIKRIPKTGISDGLYINVADETSKKHKDFLKWKFLNNSSINLNQWTDSIRILYDTEKSLFFTALLVASSVYHHVSKRNSWFPLLNLKGQKGSGKTAAGLFLLGIFTNQPSEINIKNTTKNAFMRLFENTPNIPIFLDEFKNNVGTSKIEALKGIFNLTGRTIATYDATSNVKSSNILSPCILGGQESIQDEALLSRLITLNFPLVKHTQAQKDMFKKLELEQEKGLGNIFLEIAKHQQHIISNFENKYYQLIEYFSKQANVQTRLIKNYAAYFAPLELAIQNGLDISKKLITTDIPNAQNIDIPFIIDWIRQKALHNLRVQAAQEIKADEIQVMLEIIEFLTTSPDPKLKLTNTVDYMIIPQNDQIFLRVDAIDKVRKYYKEINGQDFTDKSSLVDYLKGTDYFVDTGQDNPRRSLFVSEGSLVKRSQRVHILKYSAVQNIINLENEPTT